MEVLSTFFELQKEQNKTKFRDIEIVCDQNERERKSQRSTCVIKVNVIEFVSPLLNFIVPHTTPKDDQFVIPRYHSVSYSFDKFLVYSHFMVLTSQENKYATSCIGLFIE